MLSESFNEVDLLPNFVKLASNKYQEYWNTLSESEQIMVENQATLRTLDTTSKVDRFFESRVINNTQTKIYPNIVTVVNNDKMNEEELYSDPLIASMKMLHS